MAIFWLQPLAWWGVAALAVPVLIHLLVRQQSRRVLFPSLKFLRGSRLAALRQRTISDWLLLAVRLLILATAVAALAAPVFVSAARRQAWQTRVARAVVVAPAPIGQPTLPSDVERIVADVRAQSFASAVFQPGETIANGLRDAVEWLQRQPPASREVVVVGDLRADSLVGLDIALVPQSIGVRVLPTTSAVTDRRARIRAVAESAQGTQLGELQMLLEDTETTVTYQPTADPYGSLIEVRAQPDDQRRADAALRAVWAEGVRLHRDADRRVVIEFEGVPRDQSTIVQPPEKMWMRRVLERVPSVRGLEESGRLVVRAAIRGSDPDAVYLISRVAHAVFADDLRNLEPRAIPASALAAWSRPPTPVSTEHVPPADEGDRRYLWIATLILLALEHWLRRSRRDTPQEIAGADAVEVRVA